MNIRDIIAKRPRDNKDPSYFKFWDPIIEALENFLGEGYRVCGYDPDLQVIATYNIPDLNLDKQYSFTVPLEVAYRLTCNLDFDGTCHLPFS